MKYPVIHIPEYLLIVDERELQDGMRGWYYSSYNSPSEALTRFNFNHPRYIKNAKKDYRFKYKKLVLAHLPLNGNPVLEGVPLLPELSFEKDEVFEALIALVKDVRNKPNDTRYNTHLKIADKAIEGYKANQKKWSDENMLNAMNAACNNKFHQMHGTNDGGEEHFTFCKNYIKSLSSSHIPVAFEAETETIQTTKKEEYQYSGNHSSNLNYELRVKTVGNQWVGEWIYNT